MKVRTRKRKLMLARNVFCPTGEGGGVDPTCSAGGGAADVVHRLENWRGTPTDVVENPTRRTITTLLKDNPKGDEWAQLKGMVHKGKVYVWDASTSETHGSIARLLSKDDNAEEPMWASRFSIRVTGGKWSIDSSGKPFREPKQVSIEPYTSNTPVIDRLGSSIGLPVINSRKTTTNAAKRKRVPAGRADPTRTVSLRRRIIAELRARFSAVKKAVRKLVVDEDAFGLVEQKEFKVSNSDGNFFSTCERDEHGWCVGVSGNAGSFELADNLVKKLFGASNVSHYADDQASIRLPGNRFMEVAVKDGEASIDFGIHGEEGTFSAESLQSGSLTMMRTVRDLAKELHNKGFKISVTASNEQRKGFYERILTRLGLKLVEERKFVSRDPNSVTQVWNVSGFTSNAGRYAFQTSPEKVKLFQAWLRAQMEAVLTSKREEELWRRYAEAGYRKGAGRAFDDAKRGDRIKAEGAQKMEGYRGTRDEFLRSSFGQPVAVEKVKLLAGRSFDDLKNVTADMSTRMSRTLTDGLVEGKGPRQVAVDLARDVDVSEERALVIARTEIIRAHAEGQLDAFDSLGVEELGVEVEWSTAGDGRVCPECESFEGTVYESTADARGLIPAHPNCRCAFIPRLPDELTKNRRVPDALERFSYLLNSFCPTGEGGGVDPTCSPGGGSSQRQKLEAVARDQGYEDDDFKDLDDDEMTRAFGDALKSKESRDRELREDSDSKAAPTPKQIADMLDEEGGIHIGELYSRFPGVPHAEINEAIWQAWRDHPNIVSVEGVSSRAAGEWSDEEWENLPRTADEGAGFGGRRFGYLEKKGASSTETRRAYTARPMGQRSAETAVAWYERVKSDARATPEQVDLAKRYADDERRMSQ